MTTPLAPDSRGVRIAQWGLLAFGTSFICGIITWITHLIRTAIHLQDKPSASIGISIVAIPVFLLLLSIIHFTFWGLLRDKDRL
jgi:hypothetical protein